jgi:hypothetical protein
MPEPKPTVFEVVHEAFDLDELNNSGDAMLARKVVDAVLDLHHEYKRCCYECSSRNRGVGLAWPSIPFPCRTVKAILEAIGWKT